MQFKFDEARTVQAAAYLTQKEGGRINYTKLIKLLYLTDRERMAEVDLPITGATYYSLPHGPILSEVLDLINEQDLSSGDLWYETFARAESWDLELKRNPGQDELSRGDLEIMDRVYQRFGTMNVWTLIDWCHKNLPEWRRPPGHGRLPLLPESILAALGKSPEKIAAVQAETAYFDWVDEQFETK